MHVQVRFPGLCRGGKSGLPLRQPGLQRGQGQVRSTQQADQPCPKTRAFGLFGALRKVHQKAAFRERWSTQFCHGIGRQVDGFQVRAHLNRIEALADIHQVEPDAPGICQQFAASLQHDLRFLEFKPRAHGCQREL